MEILEYYKQQSPVTDPGEYSGQLDNLPDNIEKIVKVVQGLVVHRDSAGLYGLELTDRRKSEGETRYTPLMIEKILQHSSASLIESRPPEQRFSGVCRDFEVILCSILRHKGIPARLRCGFAGYFTPDFYEDHWLCEYWNEDESRWVLVDTNVDEVEQEAYKVTIDITDIPRDQFLIAGNVWRSCREGKLDPNKFGVSTINIKGLWFVRNNVMRDLAALNKVEVLPWDEWGLADKEIADMNEEELRLIDQAAELTTDDSRFEEMCKFYQQENLLRAPKVIKSHTTYNGIQMIELKN